MSSLPRQPRSAQYLAAQHCRCRSRARQPTAFVIVNLTPVEQGYWASAPIGGDAFNHKGQRSARSTTR